MRVLTPAAIGMAPWAMPAALGNLGYFGGKSRSQ
jgi:hypothetical protein